ncbi:MAG: DUF3617 family protein [Sterolibacterium sp.]
MKNSLLPLILGAMLAVTPATAFAEDLSPGLWEITLETRVPSAEGYTLAPNRITQCLTASDARDPSAMIGPLSTQGATGCGYTSKSYTGGNFRFAMECKGSFELKTRGDISFSANGMNGTITATGNLGGKTTEFENKISARRLGNC